MDAIAEKLTVAEFEARYGNSERAYEYWHGEAVAKSVPTWIHGRLQILIGRLLEEAGYIAGSEVELRIDPDAHLKPDVIATRQPVENPNPTRAVDIAVEILSPDDSASYLLGKCQAYAAWGFEYIYVVDPETKQLFRWSRSALATTDKLTSLPAEQIWQELDKSLRRE